MNVIINTVRILWDYILPAVPENVIECLTALTLVLFIYFVFVRLILMICKAQKAIKVTDFLVVVVCVCMIIYYITPTININKSIIDSSSEVVP